MTRIALLALPLAMLIFLAGCEEGYQSSATRQPATPPPSSVPAPIAQPQAQAQGQPQATPTPGRVSTTQPLPPGETYVNQRELAAFAK
ncbi:MAG: hypothetical protein LBU23_09940 [Planctomycetota bacterium]|jgi:hypothetical protein|nr:hypothetical protein [Planctomycetota bacterium]